MFGIGNEFFVHFDKDARKRVLHPATIVETDDGTFTAELEEEGLNAESEQNILLFYHLKGKFHQQSATVVSVEAEQPRLMLTLKTTGEPASAESREYYRVCTVLADLTVNVDGDGPCPLMDVSVTGLSVVSSQQYGIGRLMQIEFSYDDEVYRGRACVQSVKQLPEGTTRYGLLCIAEDNSDGNLRDGLRRLSMGVQRQQLQRLAGLS